MEGQTLCNKNVREQDHWFQVGTLSIAKADCPNHYIQIYTTLSALEQEVLTMNADCGAGSYPSINQGH